MFNVKIVMRDKFYMWLFLCILCIFPDLNKAQNNRKKCRCGIQYVPKIQKTIMHGIAVDPLYKYPWMIKITVNGKDHCGGAIIGPDMVLTAAHCILSKKNLMNSKQMGKCHTHKDNKDYCLHKSGILQTQYLKEDGLSDSISVKNISYSKDFSLPSHYHDIAILKVESPFPCTNYTMPICIPSKNSQDHKVGTLMTIAGWGDDQRKANTSSTESDGKLKEAIIKVRPISKNKGSCPTATQVHFCATGREGQNTCFGDSGGPIFRKVRGRHHIFGVSSYGTSATCEENSKEYFTDVPKLNAWINANSKSQAKYAA